MKSIIIIISTLLLSSCATTSIPPTNNIGSISVASGQTVYVEVTIENGVISEVIQVMELSNTDSTMTFNFMKTDIGMMLSVKNPTSKNIKYHINMIDYKGKLHKTSSCPVPAGLSVYENWSHPIPEIIITNFHILSNDSSMSCEY